jgi:hypothetical protein
MRGGIAIAAALAAALAAAVAGCGGNAAARVEPAPGEPSIDIVFPRNGARQANGAIVVKVRVRNFRLAPGRFGGEPLVGEGNINFRLNEVPACVNPTRLRHAIKSPAGRGRLIGRSFDYARYAGPNGVLAERIGSAGAYSPATRPEIYYHHLPPGFYRLIVVLAQNNGDPTLYHAVSTFQMLPPPGVPPHRPCGPGEVPSAKAAALE